jgi:hypothetical protein
MARPFPAAVDVQSLAALLDSSTDLTLPSWEQPIQLARTTVQRQQSTPQIPLEQAHSDINASTNAGIANARVGRLSATSGTSTRSSLRSGSLGELNELSESMAFSRLTPNNVGSQAQARPPLRPNSSGSIDVENDYVRDKFLIKSSMVSPAGTRVDAGISAGTASGMGMGTLRTSSNSLASVISSIRETVESTSPSRPSSMEALEMPYNRSSRLNLPAQHSTHEPQSYTGPPTRNSKSSLAPTVSHDSGRAKVHHGIQQETLPTASPNILAFGFVQPEHVMEAGMNSAIAVLRSVADKIHSLRSSVEFDQHQQELRHNQSVPSNVGSLQEHNAAEIPSTSAQMHAPSTSNYLNATSFGHGDDDSSFERLAHRVDRVRPAPAARKLPLRTELDEDSDSSFLTFSLPAKPPMDAAEIVPPALSNSITSMPLHELTIHQNDAARQVQLARERIVRALHQPSFSSGIAGMLPSVEAREACTQTEPVVLARQTNLASPEKRFRAEPAALLPPLPTASRFNVSSSGHEAVSATSEECSPVVVDEVLQSLSDAKRQVAAARRLIEAAALRPTFVSAKASSQLEKVTPPAVQAENTSSNSKAAATSDLDNSISLQANDPLNESFVLRTAIRASRTGGTANTSASAFGSRIDALSESVEAALKALPFRA